MRKSTDSRLLNAFPPSIIIHSLVMCASPEEMRTRAKWDGTGLVSRRKLLQDIECECDGSGSLEKTGCSPLLLLLQRLFRPWS
jgi:hypothetical protein